MVRATGVVAVSPADPASLAETARILRRLADDLAAWAGELRPAARASSSTGPVGLTRADLRALADACTATADAVRAGGAALHRSAYAAADHAHARSALADDARAAGLAVADTPHESTPHLTLAPGIAGVADTGQVAARARVLVEFTERRRALAAGHQGRQEALRTELGALTGALERVARALR